jgi:hypothetical protein
VEGFFNRFQHLDLITPYFSKYYEQVHEFVEKKDRERAEKFISMCPAFLAREEDESRIKELKEKLNPDKKFYEIFLLKQ